MSAPESGPFQKVRQNTRLSCFCLQLCLFFCFFAFVFLVAFCDCFFCAFFGAFFQDDKLLE